MQCKGFVKCEGKCPCQPWYSTKWESFAPGVCKFIADLAPVCGADGRTYDECTADGKFWPHSAPNKVSFKERKNYHCNNKGQFQEFVKCKQECPCPIINDTNQEENHNIPAQDLCEANRWLPWCRLGQRLWKTTTRA